MKRTLEAVRARGAMSAGFASLAVLVSGAIGLAQRPPDVEAPECVHVRAESRSDGVGFSHVVVVHNECTRAVVCSVATDVDPERQSVTVAPGRTVDVVTRIASPAPGVAARANCQYR